VKVEAATQTFATITLQNYFRMYHKLAHDRYGRDGGVGVLEHLTKLDVVVTPEPTAKGSVRPEPYRTKDP